MSARGPSLTRRRNLIVWLACAAFSVLLIATPVSLREGIARVLEWSAFLPVRSWLGWGERSLALHGENRRLLRELTDARLVAGRLQESADENQSLRRMLAMRARSDMRLIPARIVGRTPAWPGETIWIEVDGLIRTGTAVVSPAGLIGRVATVLGPRAQVTTLRNAQTVVSVIDASTREQAILRWDPARPGGMSTDPVPIGSGFRVGDAIVTSGLGEVFPRGILVGHVVGSEPDPRTQMKRIRVRPAAGGGGHHEVFLLDERPGERDAGDLYPSPGLRDAAAPALPGDPRPRP